MPELTGSLATFGIGTLVGFLCSLGKSGDLLISRDHWVGMLSLEHGRLRAAAVEDEGGTGALEFIGVALRTGDFEFSEGPPSLSANLDPAPEPLQLLERFSQAGPQPWLTRLPSAHAVPHVVAAPQLQDDEEISLAKDAVYMLLDVDGRKTVRDFAGQYGGLRAIKSLGHLLQLGLITFEANSTTGQSQDSRVAPPLAAQSSPFQSSSKFQLERLRLWGQQALGFRKELLRSGILRVVLVTGVAVVGLRAVVQNFRVEGVSMLPNFGAGQVLVVSRVAYFHVESTPLARVLPTTRQGSTRYLFDGPTRGDIVVFRAPDQSGNDYIKRVVGLPGDSIDVRAGMVFVNDRLLDEPYIEFPADYTFPDGGQPLIVPDSRYFVLGDNRPDSYDSHFGWFVPVEDLIGKAWIRYWPPDTLGVINASQPVTAVRSGRA